MQAKSKAVYFAVADSIELECEQTPAATAAASDDLPPDTVEGPAAAAAAAKAAKVRYWWRGARTRCALRFAPWLACLTALFIFLSESKTAIAAFDAGMKAIARQWSENNTEHEQTFLHDMTQVLRQGLFYYTTHTANITNDNTTSPNYIIKEP